MKENKEYTFNDFIKEYSLVAVEWYDACFHNTNISPKNIDKVGLVKLFNIGYIVKDTEDYILLATQNQAGRDNHKFIHAIPKNSITEVYGLIPD